jgi:hypothetical protein
VPKLDEVRRAVERMIDCAKMAGEVGADQKFTGPIPDNGHGLNAVDKQVQDHLLQLDPVAEYGRQRG